MLYEDGGKEQHILPDQLDALRCVHAGRAASPARRSASPIPKARHARAGSPARMPTGRMPADLVAAQRSRPPAVVLARHVQLILLFGSRLVQSVMRMTMGPLVVFICEDTIMDCTPSSKGALLSAFSLGYITTQVAAYIVVACAVMAHEAQETSSARG